MNTDTAERTIAVIAKFREIPEDQITLETSLEELKMDSLDGLNLIFELEEEFDIMIPDDKALKMKTIGEMVAGIDLIRSGESLEDVSDEDMEKFRDAVKTGQAVATEDVETSEAVETSDDVVASGDVETPEKAETEETAAEGK
jgi:acyl carrier protein